MTDRLGGIDDPVTDYPATAVSTSPAPTSEYSPARVRAGMRKRSNWEQLVKFCLVGGTGYVVNLIVYALLVKGFDTHHNLAATGSFLVAVTNNYAWNRMWTFRANRGNVAWQGMRFFAVSTLAFGANLLVLNLLVLAGLDQFDTVLAQAIAIVLVTPINFVGNKLWSFGLHHRR